MDSFISVLEWDKTGERFFETGVEKAVLYPYDELNDVYSKGVAWNGLVSIDESMEYNNSEDLYEGRDRSLRLLVPSEMTGSIEAYTYPDEFEECLGNRSGDNILNQNDDQYSYLNKSLLFLGATNPKPFGLAYYTQKRSDDENYIGYVLHLRYFCTASPADKTRGTINDDPSVEAFSWEVEYLRKTFNLYDLSSYISGRVSVVGVDVDFTKFSGITTITVHTANNGDVEYPIVLYKDLGEMLREYIDSYLFGKIVNSNIIRLPMLLSPSDVMSLMAMCVKNYVDDYTQVQVHPSIIPFIRQTIGIFNTIFSSWSDRQAFTDEEYNAIYDEITNPFAEPNN